MTHRKSLLLFVLLFSLAPPFQEGCLAARKCSTLIQEALGHDADARLKLDQARLHYLENLAPSGTRDPRTGTIRLDLSEIRTHLIPELEKLGLKPARMRVWTDGVHPIDVADGQSIVKINARPANRQADVDVEVLDRNGVPIHYTEHKLFESLKYTVAHGYQKYPVVKMKLPESIASGRGIDLDLVEISTEIQRGTVNWFLRPGGSNKQLEKAFEKYGSDLDVEIQFNKSWEPSGVKVKAPDGHAIPATLDDFYFTGGAGFSWHWFDWDSRFVSRYLRFFDPWLAERTRRLGRAAQQSFGTGKGDTRRELRFNLRPYHRPYTVKLGEKSPNLESFNPPLAGWAEREILRWDPRKANLVLPDMIDSIRSQRRWLETEEGIAVRDESGELIGFRWSALGSGRDNAFRGDLYVDLMSYYKMMIDQEREFHLMLGQWDEADKLAGQAAKVADILNKRYWNPKIGAYVDLISDGKGGYQPDHTLNAVSFWPAMGHAADRKKLSRMVEMLNDPKQFGGPCPPSLSRSDPRHRPEGNYWRGGCWPPDFVMLFDVLYENGLIVEARDLTLRVLQAMTEASNAYKLGDTPKNFIEGKVPANVSSLVKDPKVLQKIQGKTGTVFETYGIQKDSEGKPRLTWGLERREDGSVHMTRGGGEPGTRQWGFGGWGSAPALEAIRTVFGMDAVPAYVGPASGLHRWIWELLTNPTLRYHSVSSDPILKPLARFAKDSPASFEDFERFLARSSNDGLRQEMEKIAKGYVDLKLTFDPDQATELQEVVYNGVRMKLRIERVRGEDAIRVTVKSDKPIPLRFNRHWTGFGASTEASDQPYASSPVIEVGGDHPTVTIRLTEKTALNAVREFPRDLSRVLIDARPA